jgi:hypothetical protein
MKRGLSIMNASGVAGDGLAGDDIVIDGETGRFMVGGEKRQTL